MEAISRKKLWKKVMGEVEALIKKLGVKKIGLHVFGHNKTARSLYEKSGYVETSIKMEKEIIEV